MANKYAVVFTSDVGYLELATSLINGLAMYENEVDIHPLFTPCVPQDYIDALPSNCYVPKWTDIPLDASLISDKRKAWQLKFFRYLYAHKICKDYKSIYIVDSDAFVVGSMMEQFKMSEESGELVMIRNLLGVPPELATVDLIKNAVSPSYHCHGSFFNCDNFSGLLREVWDWALKEGFSDMATLYRTILRSGYDTSKIIPLDNKLWCWTAYHRCIAEKSFDETGKIILHCVGDSSKQSTFKEGEKKRVIVVHGKWIIEKWLYKHAPRLRDGLPPDATITEHNLFTFRECIQWLNANGIVKWDFSGRH